METRQVRLPSLFVILPVQIIVGVFLFMALLNGRRDLIILSGVILTMGVGAWVWSRLSPASVRCRAVVDRNRVFPGDAFTVEIDAVNGKILPIMLRMVLSSDMPFDPAEDREPVPKEGSLLWYQRVRFRWGVTAGRRGVYRLGPSRVEVGDFFGFFPRPMMDSEGVEVVVYPRIVPLALPEFPRRDFFGVPGAASPVKDPVYLLGTRDYQPWTPARFIHWKASARHDRVQEKVFEPSEREKVLLAVDVDLFAAHGARRQFEETLEVAASTAFRLHRRGCAVGLVTNGAVAGGAARSIPIAASVRHSGPILELLARLRMVPEEGLTDTMRRHLTIPWGVTCVHFSYEDGPRTGAAGTYFARRAIPVVWCVCRTSPGSPAGERGGRGRVYRLEALRCAATEDA